MPYILKYHFKDSKGNNHTVWKQDFDADPKGFAKAYPGAQMKVVNRKTGTRGFVSVGDISSAKQEGYNLFVDRSIQVSHKSKLHKTASSIAKQRWSPMIKSLSNDNTNYVDKPIDYTKSSGVKQMLNQHELRQGSAARMAGENVGSAVMNPIKERQEPLVRTGNKQVDQSVVKTKGQHEDEIAERIGELNNDAFINNAIKGANTSAANKAESNLRNANKSINDILSSAHPLLYTINNYFKVHKEFTPEKLEQYLHKSLSDYLIQLKGNKKVKDDASYLGMSTDDYIKNAIGPMLQERMQEKFEQSEIAKRMPKNRLEYILSGALNSALLTLPKDLLTNKRERQYMEQANAMTAEGKNPNFKSNMLTEVARGATTFAPDLPLLGAVGKGVSAGTKLLFGNALAQTARAANLGWKGRVAYLATTGAVSQSMTGLAYGSVNGAIQNFSTGDDTSIGNTLRIMGHEGAKSAISWGAMGAMGGAAAGAAYKASGMAGVSSKIAKFALEGISMHVGDNLGAAALGDETHWSIGGSLEDCLNVAALKLLHVKGRAKGTDGKKESYGNYVKRNISNLLTSDASKSSGLTVTPAEREQLFGTEVNPNPSGKNLVVWAVTSKYKDGKVDSEQMKNAAEGIMNDKSIPWEARAKFSAIAFGVIPTERPMTAKRSLTFRGDKGYVVTYDKDGNPIMKKPFSTPEERDRIIDTDVANTFNQRLMNAYGSSLSKDEEGTKTIMKSVAEQNGISGKEMLSILNKNPLRRSPEEEAVCHQLLHSFEGTVFTPNSIHTEQSALNGKDVAEENSLGTENPNDTAVVSVGHELQEAEAAFEKAKDSDDLLKQTYDRMHAAGAANTEIYLSLLQNGATEERLVPFAHYINANAKMQGLFQGTKDAMDQTVDKRISDWSYRGSFNGEKVSPGTTMLYVDWNGKRYIVGSGDVSFDSKGRGIEEEGDMLICLDPETNEVRQIATKEVTFAGSEKAEDYANAFRTRLEARNSVGFNQVAQERLATEQKDNGTDKNHSEAAEESEIVPQDNATSPEVSTTPLKGNTTKEELVPQEQPQQVRKFADGTDVPMITDSKGRPAPDYDKMSAEQSAEILQADFGEHADNVVDGMIKKSEKALKEANKKKVDYTAEINDIKEQEAEKAQAIADAQRQLDTANAIKKVLTARKVAETVVKFKEEKTDDAHEASNAVAKKFLSATRIKGNTVTKRLPDGTKISGHYEIVPAESLTPSHDAMNGYKMSEGFPADENGHTVNDRDYEHDKFAQQTTDQMAQKYSGQAITQVPIVSDEGIVYDGNGRTMAGQKAAKNGTDGEYIEDLMDNAQNYGFSKDDITESGIDHPRLVMVTDKRLPYDTATFAKFNQNEKKAQSNTEQAVKNAKTLTSDEVGAIVADIEGNGSLDAFFNNPKAINDLIKTLQRKGVVGENEIADWMDSPERLSAQGKERVKNLLLGSVFKPETIRLMGADSGIKTKILNGIRSVLDNLKLGDYSLRDEIDDAIRLLYEARSGKTSVDGLLRTPGMFEENSADRYEPISQMLALALDGKPADFKELITEYNRNAKARNTGEEGLFEKVPTKEEFIKEFLEYKKWKDYETRHQEREGSHDAEIPSKHQSETQKDDGKGRDESQQQVDKALKAVATEITKQTGVDVVTDEKEAQKALDEAESNGATVRNKRDNRWAGGEVLGMDGRTGEDSTSPRYFCSSNGDVYGFTVGGKIYLDTKKMKPETPLHEYTYLWTEALRNTNPDEWENVKKLFDEVKGLKDEVQKLYPELKGDDLYEEMITTFSGREGTKKLEEVVRGLAAKEWKTVAESAKATGFIGKVKEALQKYWNGVADMLHIKFTSAEEVADKVLADWAKGINPTDFKEEINRRKTDFFAEFKEDSPEYIPDGVSRKVILGFANRIKFWGETKNYDTYNCKRSTVEIKAYKLYGSEKKWFSPKYGEHAICVNDDENHCSYEIVPHKDAQGHLKSITLIKFHAFDGKEELMPLLPKEEKPDPKFNPIEAAAEDYKKEHPLSEDEILNTTAFDDLPEDQKQYCIDAALDYLNGEDTSSIAEAYYRNAYEKRANRPAETEKVAKAYSETVKAGQAEVSSDPMEGIKNAADGFEQEKAEKERKQKEATQKVLNVIKASNEKAKTRKQLEAEKNAADNEFEAFMKDLRKKRSGQLNSGFIDQNLIEAAPKMFSLAAKCAYTRIKLGMYDAKEVVKDLRNRFKDAFDGFDKRDVETFYSEIMNQKWRDGDKRMSLNEWAEHYRKLSPEYKEKLEGDSKEAEERKISEKKFISRVNIRLGFGQKIKGIVELRKMAEECGLKDVKDTDIQELAETAIVKRARGIATSASTNDVKKFELIKKLYENQPSLNQRDSERVIKQQYSTPAPYAFLADMYVKGGGKEVKSALEPSAGNGMLTIGLPMDVVHVNDIDAQRLANLRRQGFKNVTSQDGTQPFADKDVDVVVTNPPFGSATPKEYDGYKISSLEGQMAINALDSMKDDGRAAIIIGGKTEYAKNGSLNPKDKAFLGYLYSHYNVEDVINVDGSLYAKQGTSYPTRIILINGRRLDENVFPPVKSKARAESVKDYDELYKRISDDILRERKMQRESVGFSNGERGSDISRSDFRQTNPEGNRRPNNKEHGTEPETSLSDMGTRGSDERPVGETEGTSPEHLGNSPKLEQGRGAESGANRGLSSTGSGLDKGGRISERPVAGDSNETSDTGGAGRDRSKQGGYGRTSSSVREPISSREGNGLVAKNKETPKRDLSTEKVKYVPQSNNPFSLNSVVPADQAKATKKALEKIGDVDSFLVNELGYNDEDDMHHALASEQADSVALAIHQAKQGNAFIIGDMTGIGKGRQAAAMIRFAHKQGKIPVFITAKKALFSDMYRDLKSIGNSDLRPFIWSADDKEHSANMTDSEGKLVYKLPSEKEQKRVMDYLQKNGKLPDGYDYIVTTYDSFNSGTMEYENGTKKARKDNKGSKNGQRKRDVLEAIAKNANVIMDESHKAGGQGGGSAYLQYVVPKLNAITFLSATYAKRPDNMPIYALRTSMNQAGMEPSELIDAIKRGGATLQEVMSQALTASGQFIRRERDMTGVTIDWKAIDDPVVVQEQREQYDSIIGLFNDIINFQRTYVGAYLDKRNDELAAIQASVTNRQGTKDLGIHNQPFASRTYNMVQQVLLSLKAKEAAKSAIEHLKNGEKVVIALNNTNESQTDQYEANTEIEAPDLGVVLLKGLQGVLRYDQTNNMGDKTFGTFNLEELGPDAVARYHEIENNIKNASTGLSLSPIDVIRDELEGAGYNVGELTGRQFMFVKNPNGTVSKVKRTDTDKKKLALEFNTNKLDALILNRSASTGISLHDSVEYNVEHKPRTMIVVQQQADVNEEVQMRGRIDRTGQVNRGRYEYIVSQIPSEQRLLMMFKSKLRSLDANTTSSQKSKFNDMDVSDIINKYGDKVVKEYMAEHLDLYSRMADPFGWEKTYGQDLSTIDPQKLVATTGSKLGGKSAGDDASKLLGRMALLKVSEQETMLKEIGELYANEIQRLNEMGENDLEITELPLKAKTISKEVWKEGAEPGGDNAFADNTYIEKVNMAILKKPMKAEEVKKAQDGLTGGKSWDEYRESKKTEVKNFFDQKIADETQRYEERAVKIATKAKEKYQKDAKKGQKDSGMSDEQIEKMSGYQYDNIYNEEKKKLDDVVKNLKAKAEMFNRVLDTFNTEDAYVLPVDMNKPDELSGFGNSYGRLIDIKITDNFSPNASTVSFATLDGRRKITFPIAGKVGSGENRADVIGAIDRMTRQASGFGDKHLRVLSMDVANWDKLVSNESRKDGYIVTGNLIQALIDSKNQGVGGQLVKYTTDTGEVKTGILMPDRFKPTDVANEYPISSVADKFELPSHKGGIEQAVSSDGDVKVILGFDHGDTYYQIQVPKSTAKGGKYFLDKDLLSMVRDHNFESRGNRMMANIDENQLRPVLARLSNLGVKVREERKSSDDGTHFREDHGLQYSKTDTKDGFPVSSHITELSEKVGVKVNMVNSAEEVINKQVKEAIEEGKHITGWYDEKTGEVYLYLPNIHDSYTAEKTVWHETVGHKGLRGLLGEHLNSYFRSLWYDLDNPVNSELRAYVKERMSKEPLSLYNAIEEYLADAAESGKGEPGFWNNIKNKLTDALHEIGYRMYPNVKDVKYMLWLAKNVQKHPNDAVWKMRAEAVRWKIDHERFDSQQIEGDIFVDKGLPQSDNVMNMSKKDWDDFTDTGIHYNTTPSGGTALDQYEHALSRHGYMAKEAYGDNMQSLKELMRAVSGVKNVEDIASSENPYILQNTMQGAMCVEAEKFRNRVMKPMNYAMDRVLDAFEGKNLKERIRNFNMYLICKHGLERNRVLFVRDMLNDMRKDKKKRSQADAIATAWDAERERQSKSLEAGNIDLHQYYANLDKFIVDNISADYKAGEHDYSGMHGLQDIKSDKDPYDDAGAIDMVLSSEKNMEDMQKGSVNDLWKKINTATRYSIDSDYQNNIISKELHEHVSNMFNWYVPLRKYDETTAEDTYGYITEKGDPNSYIGNTLRHAKGHTYLSNVNVLAQIGAMGCRAIRNGGDNAVRLAFARFVRNHPDNNLVTETKVWYVDDPKSGVTTERYPDIPEGASADEIHQILQNFENKMKDLKKQGLARTVYSNGNIGYRFARKKDKSQHIVEVKIGGKRHLFIVNGNPRAAQALNGLLENKPWEAAKAFRAVTRFMAQMCTSYNPEFVARNIVRDSQFGLANMASKEGWSYARRWAVNYFMLTVGGRGLRTVHLSDLKGTEGFGLFAKYRNGTLDLNNETQRYFKEFMDNGGETGWVQIKNMDEWAKENENYIKGLRSNTNVALSTVYDFFFGNLRNINEVAENIARFATYCTSRNMGRSIVRSAYDAKQSSANFNRKGSGNAIGSFKQGDMSKVQLARRGFYSFSSSYLRQLSMFFNASAQSAQQLFANAKGYTAGTIVNTMSIPFILGSGAALLNYWLINNEDEKERKDVKDPYSELPDYIRRNNLCIYTGKGNFATIPLAIEIRAFYGLGDLAAGFTPYGKNLSDSKNIAMDAIGSLSQLLPVVDYMNNSSSQKDAMGFGKETIKALLPSTLQPVFEYLMNSDWKGAPIQRNGEYYKNTPAWQRAYTGTPDMLLTLNKYVNAQTNDVDKGNSNMMGNKFLDEVTNPSLYNHVLGTFGSGIADFTSRAIGVAIKGKDAETKDIPFVRSFVYTPNEQSALQRTKTKWYNYKSDLETSLDNYKKLKKKDVPLTERINNAASLYHFEQSNLYDQINIVENTEKSIKRWTKLKKLNADNKEQVDFANDQINQTIENAVEELDKLN